MIAYLVLHIKHCLFRNKQNQFHTCISFPHCNCLEFRGNATVSFSFLSQSNFKRLETLAYSGLFKLQPFNTFLSIWITFLVNGWVKAFKSLGGSFWVDKPNVSTVAFDKLWNSKSPNQSKVKSITDLIINFLLTSNIPVVTSSVNKTMTVNQLKKSRITPAEKARPNCSMSPTCVNATIVLVTEVPIFAPMTIGTAYLEIRHNQIFVNFQENKYLLYFNDSGSHKPDNYWSCSWWTLHDNSDQNAYKNW